MSSEVESPTDESRPSGLLGHTIIRAFGAIIPAVQDQSLMHAGWGTGLTVSYGVARAAQVSLGLAYHQFQVTEFTGLDCDCSVSPRRNEIRQTTMSVELQPPTRRWIRPRFGVGFGVYELTETQVVYTFYSTGYNRQRYVSSGTQLGINWGVGLSARVNQRLAVEFGGRYHLSFGQAFLTEDQYLTAARLLSVETGLSYVIH